MSRPPTHKAHTSWGGGGPARAGRTHVPFLFRAHSLGLVGGACVGLWGRGAVCVAPGAALLSPMALLTRNPGSGRLVKAAGPGTVTGHTAPGQGVPQPKSPAQLGTPTAGNALNRTQATLCQVHMGWWATGRSGRCEDSEHNSGGRQVVKCWQRSLCPVHTVCAPGSHLGPDCLACGLELRL